MKELKNDFKINQFKSVYLLYGDESYMIRYYSDLFTERLLATDSLTADTVMNRDIFEGRDFDIDDVIDAAETLPFLSEHRLIYIKDSGLLTTGRKADSETLAKYLPSIPESSIIIFVETVIDKRNKLYKLVASQGRAVECTSPSESDLIKWIGNIFKKKNKEINPQTARLLLSTVPKGMDQIYTEADKLGDFVGERSTITPDDIETVCTKSLEARIFDLVGFLCTGQTEKALVQYHNMLIAKEQPLMILTMMARQFRLVLQCKAATEKHMAGSQIAQSLGLRDFMVRDFVKQAQNFSVNQLIEALHECQDTDIRIKTGWIAGELGVELLIIKYSNPHRRFSPEKTSC